MSKLKFEVIDFHTLNPCPLEYATIAQKIFDKWYDAHLGGVIVKESYQSYCAHYPAWISLQVDGKYVCHNVVQPTSWERVF